MYHLCHYASTYIYQARGWHSKMLSIFGKNCLLQPFQTAGANLSMCCKPCNLCAGKYLLQKGLVIRQNTITAAAQEKLFPNRAALVHFYVDADSFDRERRVLSCLPPGKHTPGQLHLGSTEQAQVP